MTPTYSIVNLQSTMFNEEQLQEQLQEHVAIAVLRAAALL
jgi:hypothetical protein